MIYDDTLSQNVIFRKIILNLSSNKDGRWEEVWGETNYVFPIETSFSYISNNIFNISSKIPGSTRSLMGWK